MSQKMRTALMVSISQAKGRANEKLRFNYGTNERRFYCYPVAPRCWACEKYILSQERFLCKRSRERGHKKYILCQECFDAIPAENKTVVGKEKLLNSVCTKVDKKTILEWPSKKSKSSKSSYYKKLMEDRKAAALKKAKEAEANKEASGDKKVAAGKDGVKAEASNAKKENDAKGVVVKKEAGDANSGSSKGEDDEKKKAAEKFKGDLEIYFDFEEGVHLPGMPKTYPALRKIKSKWSMKYLQRATIFTCAKVIITNTIN